MGTAEQPARITRQWLIPAGSLTAGVIGVVAGILAIAQFIGGTPEYNLTGEWGITNTIQQTTLSNSNGLSLGYRVILNQNGTQFEGSGEKRTENGHELPSNARTRIIISGGSIQDERVTAMFTEQGTNRPANGEFTWKMKGKRNFAGTFISTAAGSSGSSTGARTPEPSPAVK